MVLKLLHANDNVLMQFGFVTVIKGGGIEQIDKASNETELRRLILLTNYV